MEFRRILTSMSQKWRLILTAGIIFGIFGLYLSILSAPPMYRAEMTLYVLNRSKVNAGQALSTQDLTLGQQLLKQFSGIFKGREVTSAAEAVLDAYAVPREELDSMVTLSSTQDSNILRISVESPDANLAAEMANVMGNEFISLINLITQTDFIGILDEAVAPLQPVPNHGPLKTLLWTFCGIMFAVTLIYIQEIFDATILTAEEIENEVSLRVIGIIPEHDIR